MTPRDTFVRYVDPLRTSWQDADGNLHFSVDNALRAFDLPDTPEHREAVKKLFRRAMEDNGEIVMDRAAPDTPEYWTQVAPENRPPEFRHLPFNDPT